MNEPRKGPKYRLYGIPEAMIGGRTNRGFGRKGSRIDDSGCRPFGVFMPVMF
jgi:hypothetical protein